LMLMGSRPAPPEKQPAASAAQEAAPGTANVPAPAKAFEAAPPAPWFGYLWLLVGSAYLLLRCLIDLALTRRPALAPNLTFGGMAWLAGAMFVCLMAVAFRSTDLVAPSSSAAVQARANGQDEPGKAGKESAALDLAQRPLETWGLRALAVACHLAVAL